MKLTRAEPVIVSGWAATSTFAPDFPALITAISEKRLITSSPWFATEEEWQDLRLSCNPHSSVDNSSLTPPFSRLQKVIEQAMQHANLTLTELSGKKVRVYIIGNGMRSDIADFIGYQDRNDREDLLFFPKIKNLHASNYAQDRLAHELVNRYQLSWPPISLYCASNSSLAALHLAQNTIADGDVDLVMIVGWIEVMFQDIMLMGGQGMLGNGASQPFSQNNNSVLPANGIVALIVESEKHARQREFTPSLVLSSSVCCQSSGSRGGNSFSADFRSVAQTLEKTMSEAGITPEDIACIFPHGNGIIASDKAEAMAILKIWGKCGVPVVSYKGQLGYALTCSGLLDLMIAADALQQRRLLAVTTRHPIDDGLQIHVHADSPPLPLEKDHILKSGMGLDGSAIAMVLSAYQDPDYQRSLHALN